MSVKQGASTTITSMKKGTTAITKVKRGGVNVWPTTGNSTVAWAGMSNIVWPGTDSSYWFYDELALSLHTDGAWVVTFWRNGIGGGSPSAIFSGTWATPTTSGLAAGYECRVQLNYVTSGDWTNSASVWGPITGSPVFSVRTRDTYPVLNNTESSIQVQVRGAGTTVVLLDTNIVLGITA